MKDLKSEFGGNFEEVTLAMMEPCELFDARSHEGMCVFLKYFHLMIKTDGPVQIVHA